MNILAIDTADQVLSAALETKSGFWYSEINAGSRHSELLLECVDGLFKSACQSPLDLNFVACMKGPGSFTGLRIGFSTAKGICRVAGIPLITVSTLDCLAFPHSVWPGIVLPAIDAKKGCFFAALYREGKRLTDQLDAPPETLAKLLAETQLNPDERVLLTGSGADMLCSGLSAITSSERIFVNQKSKTGMARELHMIAKNCIITQFSDDIDSGPEYIRKSDAELKSR